MLYLSAKFNLKINIIRPFNVYGPGIRGIIIMPNFIDNILNKKIKSLWYRKTNKDILLHYRCHGWLSYVIINGILAKFIILGIVNQKCESMIYLGY